MELNPQKREFNDVIERMATEIILMKSLIFGGMLESLAKRLKRIEEQLGEVKKYLGK